MDKYKYLLQDCLLMQCFLKEKYLCSLNIQKLEIGKIARSHAMQSMQPLNMH